MLNTLAAAPETLAVLATLVLTVLLALIGWNDARSRRIPDNLSLPLIGFGLLWAAIAPDAAILPHLIGAGLGYGILALIGETHFRRHGTEGLGLGDAKLFAAAGAWLGWQALPPVLLIAAVTGLAFALLRRALGGSQSPELAFGPWLALALWLVWMMQTYRPAAWPFA